MGITLYFSNQLMPLAEKLHDNLTPAGADILQPALVVVPNMNLSKWIKLTLARRAAIFMNVEFAYLEKGLWHMLRSLGAASGPQPEMLDQADRHTLLFFILMSAEQGGSDLNPVTTYLGPAEGGAGGHFEIRCWQLAGELARLFQDYEYHRTQMIDGWLDDQPCRDAMEASQKWIYRRMHTLNARLGRYTGRRVCGMFEYARSLGGARVSGQSQGHPSPSRVHLFGLSQISAFHLQLLQRLGSAFDLHIYSLNPSREYWEDVRSPLEKRWIERKRVSRLQLSPQEWSDGDLAGEADHALLSAWGKPGREGIRLLCRLTDYDFQAGFSEAPPPDTVLAAIGHGLLTLAGGQGGALHLPQDRSLQITACPSIRREVETVYHSILYNLETVPELKMTDIAVMVSDMARYKPVVDSVFNRRPARISYNLVDAAARTESLFAQAVLALMALARGNFSRKQVFDLLRNPCVMQRWDYGPETLAVWIGWAEGLGIYHGYENPSTPGEDSPPAGLHSWRQGLERLRISRIMTTPAPISGGPRRHYHGLVPFADINTGDDRLLEKFCALVEALAGAVASFQRPSATARSWRDCLLRSVDQLIEISGSLRGEKTVFESLLDALDGFVRYDDLNALEPGRPLTAEALWAFVSTHLDGLSGGQGDYLTGGVTVSALMPMRPIPFSVVYVLGLEEGRFPGRSPDNLLDLRNRKRCIGDVSLAERNRYLFLETLIAVRTKLYLSYLSRDLQKDRELAPCSVVHQLRRHVEQQILGGRPFLVRQVPIHGDSPAYIAPDAIRSWSDVMVNSNVAQRLSCYRRHGLEKAFAEQATLRERETAARYRPRFQLPDPLPHSPPPPDLPLSIGLLRRFLLDPVTVVGQYHLGVAEPVDGTAELAQREHEPLASRFPIDFEIRTTPLQNWLTFQSTRAGCEPSLDWLAVEFESLYADLSRKSRVPVDAFARQDKTHLKGQVMAMGERLYPFILQMRSARQCFAAVMAGSLPDDAGAGGGVQLRLDPVAIDLGASAAAGLPKRVQLSGGMQWIWQAPDADWHCVVVTGSNRKPRFPDRYVIGPLLTLMALSAAEQPNPWSEGGRVTLHVIYREHLLSLSYGLDPGRSAAYLAGLVDDVLTPSPLVWLPFERLLADPGLRAAIGGEEGGGLHGGTFFEALLEAFTAADDVTAQLTGAVVTPDILVRARRRFGVFVPRKLG